MRQKHRCARCVWCSRASACGVLSARRERSLQLDDPADDALDRAVASRTLFGRHLIVPAASV